MSKVNKNRRYSNGTMTVIWQPAECIHAGVCFTDLRKVFDPAKRPWVNMLGGTTEQIIDIVERCPTVALTFMWDDPELNARATSSKIFKGNLDALFPTTAAPQFEAQKPASTIVTIRSGGPLVLEGDFSILGPDGKRLKTMKMASLCRCGLSSDQPFCDGAHFKAGFRG